MWSRILVARAENFQSTVVGNTDDRQYISFQIICHFPVGGNPLEERATQVGK
jgi:hypothetical protein